MKIVAFTIFGFFLCLPLVQAQGDETLIGKTGLRLTGFWGGTNVGFVGTDGERTGVSGGFFGLEFNKSLMLGFGNSNGSIPSNYGSNYRIKYNGLLLGYTYRSHKVVHPRVSFLMGSGSLKSKDIPDDNLFVVQPSAGIEVNLFRWFRMGVEGGYRFVSNVDLPKSTDVELSAPFAQLSFRFGWSWRKA